ncbi:putative yir1 protein [Plasmodium yoelii yoelii]|uniref:Yir1 protein n=1 Tax=Plasmodium yoelii yoelii TaxID=73239 RepID=Q7RNP6_PLAYO|nr:putative yir1 protein [Plasmodium yoelii yoelii]
MDYELCENFNTVIEEYPDELNNSDGNRFYRISGIDAYCFDEGSGKPECKTELDKINALCLWFLNENIAYRIKDLSKEKINVFIIYIMIWLNYMLNLKKDDKTNLNNLYTKHIEKDANYTKCKRHSKDCNSTLKENTGYNNFKEIMVERKDLLNINYEDISKFYEAFKLLCKIPTENDEDNLECTKYLEYANDIVEKFKKLNENSSATGNTSYNQVWSTLSTDYDSFKNKYNGINCMNIPSLPSIKTTQHHVQSSDVTSSSFSIVKKLILALSIFSAITIFLGIFYKVNNKKFKNYFH